MLETGARALSLERVEVEVAHVMVSLRGGAHVSEIGIKHMKWKLIVQNLTSNSSPIRSSQRDLRK
jgi:hypothetical protein